MKSFVAFLIAAFLLLIGCGKEKPTQPPAQQGTLLLSRLVVSMVPGRTETVTISAAKPDGTPDPCTITNGDPGVASAALSDSIIQITGVSYGTTNITVRSGSGKDCTLPVQVYDPTVIDTGELLITFTDQFRFLAWWNDQGGYFWKPIPPEGYYSLGDYMESTSVDPNGRRAVMVVKAKPGSDAIVLTGEVIYPYLGYYTDYMGIPDAPEGYVPLGYRMMIGAPWDEYACIREDLTELGEMDSLIFQHDGYSLPLRWWAIEQPVAGPHSAAYLAPGCWICNVAGSPPTDPAMNVLKVDLPMLSEAPMQSFMPKLTGFAAPPSETVPLFAKAMLAPCTIVRDAMYDDNLPWRIANSPFYRLERHVYYKLLYHNYNQTSEVQTNSVLIRSGVITTESETFRTSTAVSVTFEAGVDIELFSSKVTATISTELGYETQTSVAELQQKDVTTSINTPPGKAAALWQEYNRYIFYRHNGTDLEPVSSWEFGIDSYVTDEYPDD